MKKKIIIITPIKHIGNLFQEFRKNFFVTYKPNINYKSLLLEIHKYDILFTNPNKSRVFLDSKILNKAKKLKIISTASTGTNHIDEVTASKFGIKILSLKKERKYMSKITSTSDLAFGLMLNLVRNISSAEKSVMKNEWNYEPYIGRQINYLKIGVIGYGRLGSIFLKYASIFSQNLYAYDPLKKNKNKKIKFCKSIKEIFKICDVISLHVHVSKDTINLINKSNLKFFQNGSILINTSRGDLINEVDLIKYLKKNNKSKYGTDVLKNEIHGIKNNVVYKSSKLKNLKNRILITPHIGGMTKEAQLLAYSYSLKKLLKNIDVQK